MIGVAGNAPTASRADRPPQRCDQAPPPHPHRRQRLNGLMLEHHPRRERQPRTPRPAHQLDRHDAVAAKLEEVVVDPDPLHTQHLGEQPAQHCLLRRPRRALRPPRAKLRRRQRPPVELAVRRQRQPIQHHDRRRHHVVRQRAPTTAEAPPGPAPPPSGHHIAHQPLRLPAQSWSHPAAHHGRLRHARLPQQHSLDLARLDPEPASFTCASARPRNSSTPSDRHRARSPVRYIRAPAAPCGSATNRSAVSPARFR